MKVANFRDTFREMATSKDAGNAVGVPESLWYVAFMRKHNTEKASAERLRKMGYDSYVATQQEWRVWRNGKRKKIDRVVIPSVVFIRCTETERKIIVHEHYISRFMMDRAGTDSKVATIPPLQIERLRFMLNQSDIPVTITERPYQVGDKVRIIRGSLTGLEGEVFDMNSEKSELVVLIEHFGCAKLMVDTISIELIKEKEMSSEQ